MRQLPALALVLLCAAPASAAEAPMTAEEFEAFVTGKTLTYALQGEVYGAEQYLPGRRVIWAFKDGECRRGFWYELAGEICFVYEDVSTPQCWRFLRGAGGLRAKFSGDPDGAELAAVQDSKTPLICAGPDLGV
jgi:hypothetical protein